MDQNPRLEKHIPPSDSKPQCFARIDISKHANGYTYHTSVTLTWLGAPIYDPGDSSVGLPDFLDPVAVNQPMPDGSHYLESSRVVLGRLLEEADAAARGEIKRRQELDAAARP